MKQTSAKHVTQDATLKEITGATFDKDVVRASQTKPVLAVFWFNNCPVCQELLPLLSSAVASANGTVSAVKINVEENASLITKLLPTGLPLQIIPLVVAYGGGKVIACLNGKQSKVDIEEFVSSALKKAPSGPSPADELILRGNALIIGGEAVEAQKLFSLILDENPHNLRAWSGLIRALIAVDDEPAAKTALRDVPQELRATPQIRAVSATLQLKEKGRHASEDLEQIKSQLSHNPNNHQAQFSMSLLLNSADKKEEAVDMLAGILKRDKSWENNAAYKQLIEMFTSWGSVAPATIYGYKKLHELGCA